MRFVDTNVLLYAALRDPEEQTKAERARALLGATDLAVSVQVLQEFYAQATRETRPFRLSHDEAGGLVEAWLRFRVASLTTGIVLAAIATCRRFQVSYWDAAILEAARTLGCETVLSEDLREGMDYGGVRVEDPFRGVL